MEYTAINEWSVLLRILLALIFGGLLGMERDLKNRPAGIRTYMLVSVGACLIMLTNLFLFQATGTGDPVRLGAQVVSGMGFLGAGTIIVTRNNQIKGLTTAAGLWTAGAVGLALGAGFYVGAIAGGLAIFLVLTTTERLDNRLRARGKGLELYVEISDHQNVSVLLRNIRALGAEVDEVQVDHDTAMEEGSRALLLTLRKAKGIREDELVRQIGQLDGILSLEVL